MKKTYLIASFVAISASAIGASAITTINGSDTLYTISTDIITGYTGFPSPPAGINPVTGLTYLGGGSGVGEGNMVLATPSQQTAPMSRFLKGTCTQASASPTTSEGMVIGLDGVSLFLNRTTGASDSCNGSPTDPAKDGSVGLVSNRTITWASGTYTTYNKVTANYSAGAYTFTDWSDVVRILFAGMNYAAGNTAANQNCKSDVRAALINNWGLLFENQGCSSGSCATIKHGFRRDDFSGTTDVIQSVLNLPSIPSNKLTDPFCNSALAANSAAIPGYMQIAQLGGFMDLDPIRTVCADSDILCNADGTIGWEMVIEPATNLTTEQAYPTAQGTSNMGFGYGYKVGASGNTYACPNGDTPQFITNCLVPVDSSGNMLNTASKGSRPIFSFGGANFNAGIDGRVYNSLNHASGTAGGILTAPNGQAFQGSWFRAYSACTQRDATDQIGCLVGTAEPCSIAYAGLGASTQTNANPARLDGVAPITANIQSFAYPLARKLFLNTVKGFENVVDTPNTAGNGELQFAKNFARTDERNYYLAGEGFIALPSTLTIGGAAGAAFCEDFNERILCGSTTYPTNGNACSTNPSGIPSTGTTCGNSILEDYERCDSGNSTGTSGSNCSATCTCKKGNVDAAGHCCVNSAGVDCCLSGSGCTPGQNI